MFDLMSILLGGLPTRNNTFIDIDDNNYISFNPSAFDTKEPETAIVTRDPWRCLILLGNHLEAYQAILDTGAGLKGCIEYFEVHQDLKTSTSDSITLEQEAIAA